MTKSYSSMGDSLLLTPADAQRELAGQPGLHGRDGPERRPQVGARERVQRGRIDEVVRRLASPQLLDLVVKAKGENEFERLQERKSLRTLQRAGGLRSPQSLGRRGTGHAGRPARPACQAHNRDQPAFLDIELPP